GRFLARPRGRPPAPLVARRIGRGVVRPEARERTADGARAPVRHALDARADAGLGRRRVAGVRLQPADAAFAARVDEDETSLGIDGDAAPARGAERTRKNNRRARLLAGGAMAVWRE